MLVLAALAISIPTATASAGTISVSASLGTCEPRGGAILCQINARFTEVGGADYYTASVTGPDGARQSLGTVPAGAASVWARYSADGTYTITITAWGDGTRVKRGSARGG